MKKLLFGVLAVLFTAQLNAQGALSGDVMMNAEFYQRDSLIGASGTPHYDNLLSGTNTWINTNYRNDAWGLEAGVRVDLFLNSNLHNPGIPYTGAGLGRYYVSKKIDNLKITGGHIYDQFGSGLTFRSYEERPLGIDNALFGISIAYDFNENLKVKAIAGQQKDLFTRFNPVIKGATIEGNVPMKNENIILAPGASFVNRTIDQNNMDIIISQINTYELEDRFFPKYNVYAASVFNTLTVKNVTWYAEYARKSSEAVRDITGQLVDTDGDVLYSSLTYSTSKIGDGFGLTGQVRIINDWVMRTSPNETLLDGIINYLPSLTRQNSLRLTARYQAVAQELGEFAYQVNGTFTPKKGYTFNANFAQVTNDSLDLFQEIFFDFEMRKKTYKILIGGQLIHYNQAIYENEPDRPMVEAITPFAEFLYKFDRKKSIRMELQYQHCEQDFGSWVYGLAEFTIAPHWSFSVSDMWNYEPLRTEDDLHYYSVFAAYTNKASRFTLNYVKQIAGIVCTGGVCRFEPAFSGIKAGFTTSF